MVSQNVAPVPFPELFFGIAGPIGVDVDLLTTSLTEALRSVKYHAYPVKLTTEMRKYPVALDGEEGDDLFTSYNWKMDYANELRSKFELKDVMARIAIDAIRDTRPSGPPKVTSKQAFIIRQLKLPQEVQLLRRVYGRQFILVSAYGETESRAKRLFEQIKAKVPTDTAEAEIQHKVDELIKRDNQEDTEFGQNLSDTFHLGDVVVDGINRDAMIRTLSRFVSAFFGKNDITPTKDEHGMYMAKSASLRSADLSRQVGASIFAREGDVLTQGCNEVPKAGGGTYWEQETPDHRDIRKGSDPNDRIKKDVLRNCIERLRRGGYLSDKAIKLGRSDLDIVNKLIQKNSDDGVLADAWVMDLTEFGRVVHAEMNAICDAARRGLSISGATLYCTTFPCHNCTKHILSSGITRVVYMEPYPKSRAKELHGDEIELGPTDNIKRVPFEPFQGISPYRYRDIFQKMRRKNPSDGQARTWYADDDRPHPMIDVDFPTYVDGGEEWAIAPLYFDVTLTGADSLASSQQS